MRRIVSVATTLVKRSGLRNRSNANFRRERRKRRILAVGQLTRCALIVAVTLLSACTSHDLSLRVWITEDSIEVLNQEAVDYSECIVYLDVSGFIYENVTLPSAKKITLDLRSFRRVSGEYFQKQEPVHGAYVSCKEPRSASANFGQK
jgi:hypothetical protein